MKLMPLLKLSSKNLLRTKAKLILAGLGISFGIFLFTFFLALKAGVSEVVLGKIFPIDQIEIARPSNSLNDALSLFDGQVPSISESEVKRIQKIPGVKEAYPRLRIAFPFSGSGGQRMLQKKVGIDLIGDGVPSHLIDDLEKRTKDFDYLEPLSSLSPCKNNNECNDNTEYCLIISEEEKTGQCHKKIPIIISKYLVEFYNGTVAPTHNLPRVGEWMIDQAGGLEFNLELGKGYFTRAKIPRGLAQKYVAKIVGVSRHAIDIGITVPIEYAREWNRNYIGDEAAQNYSSVTVIVNSADDVKNIKSAITDMGLEILSRRAEQAAIAITIITGLLMLVSFLIIFMAGVNIYQTFFLLVYIRKYEIGLYRALGASKRDIRNAFLFESSIVGFLSGIVGIGSSYFIAGLIDYISNNYLPDFPFKPETYFNFTPSILTLAITFAVVCCLAGAYLPAWRASNLDPVKALS